MRRWFPVIKHAIADIKAKRTKSAAKRRALEDLIAESQTILDVFGTETDKTGNNVFFMFKRYENNDLKLTGTFTYSQPYAALGSVTGIATRKIAIEYKGETVFETDDYRGKLYNAKINPDADWRVKLDSLYLSALEKTVDDSCKYIETLLGS